MAMGNMKSKNMASTPDKMNFTLYWVKKKNAKPTMPYSFTNVPKAIKKADLISCFFIK
ncbi:hypothetical protein GCM10011413_42550 [Pedobacter psychrotolerans]|uniref:Uncharacterized protein n=1 Tax=Pedobacter psychrotolerans TaxID=1843235 RepID=A0ABQ1SYY7_9SPHI|nr:hypothetical protein GCM10011413_42550 [Pedobacter psychrotolerans]